MLIKVKERGFCILWSRTKNVTAVSKVTPQASPILALPMTGGAWGGLEQPFSMICSDSRSTPAHRALASTAGHPVASPGVHQAHVESHLPEDTAARVPKCLALVPAEEKTSWARQWGTWVPALPALRTWQIFTQLCGTKSRWHYIVMGMDPTCHISTEFCDCFITSPPSYSYTADLHICLLLEVGRDLIKAREDYFENCRREKDISKSSPAFPWSIV